MKLLRRKFLAGGIATVMALGMPAEARLHGGVASGGGGAAVTLTPWTITEQSGSTQTNVPIEVWLPAGPAAGIYGYSPVPLPSTSAVQVLDSDGHTVIPCQEDGRIFDQNGECRGVHVSAILPTLTASQARQLTIQQVPSTSPTTGTDITIADILAVDSNVCSLSVPLDDGHTYTATAGSGLNAGTSFVNLTTPVYVNKWFSGGGFETEHYVKVPLLRSGSTPTPDNIWVHFLVAAYKNQRGAVSGGNPITAIKVRYWLELGWAQASYSSVNNHYYDLTATCGSNTQSWVGSSPAQTITFAANSAQTQTTASVGSSLFTTNSIGTVIGDSSGQAVIVAPYISATQANVYICNPMSGTTITSGNWRIYGLTHGYGAKMPMQEIWYGGSLAINAKPNLDSTLGVAWNSGAQTGGPFSYFVATGAILPYDAPASSLTNSLTNINGQGTNPTGFYPGMANDIVQYMEQPGSRSDIGPLPGWHVNAMIKADANAKTVIFADALKFCTMPIFWRDDTTGTTMLLNNGTDYYYIVAYGSPVLPSLSNGTGRNNLGNWYPELAHCPSLFYVPWLYTGDFYWVDCQQQKMFWTWANGPGGTTGTQLNRLSCNTDEERGNCWAHGEMMRCIQMTPASGNAAACLGWSRSHVQTWHDNHFTAVNSNVPGTTPYPGINIGCINNTGAGKTFAASGYRSFAQIVRTVDDESQWQLGYGLMNFMGCKGSGMTNSYDEAFIAWFLVGLTGAVVDPNVVFNWCVPCSYISLRFPDTTIASSWTDCYRSVANLWDANGNGVQKRFVIGTGMSLSGTSGSALTVTIPANYVNGGGSAFYAQGLVRDWNAASLQIIPNVVAGGANYAVNDTITCSFVGLSGNFTETTAAVLKVTGTGAGGAVTSVSVQTPGLYINQNTPSNGWGSMPRPGGGSGYIATITQASSSGSGTGATFGNIAAPDDNEPYLLRFGTAQIVSVSGNQLTLTTNATNGSFSGSTVEYYAFAQTALATDLFMIPAPSPSDSAVGYNQIYNHSIPLPYSSYYEYWQIAWNASRLAKYFGYTNGAAANAVLETNYTGGDGDEPWYGVSP